MHYRYSIVNEYWDRLKEVAVGLKKSPLRLAALIILAIIIFSVLVALLVVMTPKETFEVKCVECGGRDGNLVTISGTQASFDAVVQVKDSSGDAVANATVKIAGGDETSSAKTNSDGMATVHVNVTLEQGKQSALLKVITEKAGFRKYAKSNFIVVARQ